MRMKMIQILRAARRGVQRILDAQLPMAEMYGLRTRGTRR